MRNRVHLRSKQSFVSAFLAVAMSGVLCVPREAATASPESADAAAAQEEVGRSRRDLEVAFLDVQRDHARVRLEEWARTPFGDAFTAVLKQFVQSARSQSPPRGDVDDAAAAADVLRQLTERRVEPPLTGTSRPVVLAQTARSARADATGSERELFLAAARATFAEPRPEDAWDARFLGLPVVVAYRAANAKLAIAHEKDAAPPPADPSGPKATEGPAEKSSADPTLPSDDMVLCDRTKVWTGPWSGWTTDIPENKNKRQQRTLKVIWIDRFEVTCAQYRAFLEKLGPSGRRAMLPQEWTLDEKDAVMAPDGKDRHPVTGVTFEQAQAFAESLGKRLPTSDEWERAAGGAEKEPRAFPWGASAEGKTWAHAAVEAKGTFPVDAFEDDATPERVVGLAGNVAEMVASYPDRTEVGKAVPEKGRQVFVCGGSYKSRASECGPGWRWVIDADGASPSVGFRCVMDDAEYRKRHK